MMQLDFKQFFKGFKFFSHIEQSVLLVLLQRCLKKAGIQFNCNNVLSSKDGEY